MKRVAILAVVLTLAAGSTIAQQADEPMFVSLNYITVKAGMNEAFMAAVADHLEWHKSTNDTHYYDFWQVMSGPRTGQFMFSVGPVTGEQLDDHDAFAPEDFGDWAARGGWNYVDGIETIIMATMPNFGNPPPPDAETPPMVHVWEMDLEPDAMFSFMEALGRMQELQQSIGADDYSAWLMPVTGISFSQRWLVSWTEGWADTLPTPEEEARVAEAAGGMEAYQELINQLASAVEESMITTYMFRPDMSFRPDGQ